MGALLEGVLGWRVAKKSRSPARDPPHYGVIARESQVHGPSLHFLRNWFARRDIRVLRGATPFPAAHFFPTVRKTGFEQ